MVTHAARAFIPMMELIDREKEQARLAKEKAQCEKEIASMAAKLSNEGFVNKAPAHIVEDMRQKHAAAAEKLTEPLREGGFPRSSEDSAAARHGSADGLRPAAIAVDIIGS